MNDIATIVETKPNDARDVPVDEFIRALKIIDQHLLKAESNPTTSLRLPTGKYSFHVLKIHL